MRGTVASGHELTSRAAIHMFKSGGNAFDAVVSAGFASVVSEPTLTSLGGGGFLLAHIKNENRDVLFDFFVNAPGLGIRREAKPEMKPVEIRFPRCVQVFHIGFGSVAVPAMLKGLLYIHSRLCTLPLKMILEPALTYLDEGVVINENQETVMSYLEPIFTLKEYGRHIYMSKGKYLRRHDRIHNPLLRKFLKKIADNSCDFYTGAIADKLIAEVREEKGVLSNADLEAYRVVEKEPLRIRYRDREILTNPPPSYGGILLALNLKLLEKEEISCSLNHPEEFLVRLIESMRQVDSFRSLTRGDRFDEIEHPFDDARITPFVDEYLKCVSEKSHISMNGTTHISVTDESGNAASMTTSNGSGSGCFIPDTGVMLNNMMGEDDLHPQGFFRGTSGKRVASMMIPTLVKKNDKIELALGSGGSKRIRTAILQVLINIIDFGLPLKDSIEASRIHLEDGVIQAEPGMPSGNLEKIGEHYKFNVWDKKNMYFGGVHASKGDLDAYGDSRRDGNVLFY
jgi:gamma-glutamyltranspeptidase/glutathione hydrolase